MSPRTPLPLSLNAAATRPMYAGDGLPVTSCRIMCLREERTDVRMHEHVVQREAKLDVGATGPREAWLPCSSVLGAVSWSAATGTIGLAK